MSRRALCRCRCRSRCPSKKEDRTRPPECFVTVSPQGIGRLVDSRCLNFVCRCVCQKATDAQVSSSPASDGICTVRTTLREADAQQKHSHAYSTMCFRDCWASRHGTSTWVGAMSTIRLLFASCCSYLFGRCWFVLRVLRCIFGVPRFDGSAQASAHCISTRDRISL